jgi:ankyrin repeat protein
MNLDYNYSKKKNRLHRKINQKAGNIFSLFSKKKNKINLDYNKINLDYNKELLDFIKKIDSNYSLNYKNTIEDLLDNGANFFIFDDNDNNAFNYSIIYNNINIFKIFLEHYKKHYLKNDINIQNKLGKTAFYIACENGRLDIIKILVTITDMNPNIYDIMKKTPFLISCYYNFLDIVSFLTKISIKNEIKQNNEIKEFLIDFNLIDKNNQSAIHHCSNIGNESIIIYLLDFKDSENKNIIQWDFYDKFGDKPFHIAAKKGHQKIIQILSLFIKNIYEKNKNGYNMAAIAAENGQTNIINYLSNFKYDFNIPENKYGQTPCFIASKNNYRETLIEILKYGGNFNLATPEITGGFSPFFISLYNRNIDISKLLIINGYNPRIRDFNFLNSKILLNYLIEWINKKEKFENIKKQLTTIYNFYN